MAVVLITVYGFGVDNKTWLCFISKLQRNLVKSKTSSETVNN
jgi:hypothetical protein